MKNERFFFIFDVESVGLFGEGFAVGGGVYLDNGAVQYEFEMACPLEAASGDVESRIWVQNNVPVIIDTHRSPLGVRMSFWETWRIARHNYPGIFMAADVPFPVETNFLSLCLSGLSMDESPYPLIDIASVLLAAGMDPLATYQRTASEEPKHHPRMDARQSARLFFKALAKGSHNHD